MYRELTIIFYIFFKTVIFLNSLNGLFIFYNLMISHLRKVKSQLDCFIIWCQSFTAQDSHLKNSLKILYEKGIY